MSRSLSPCPAEVQVERLIAEADHITLVVRVFRPVAPCPGCTCPSYRIHSYYERRLADLPWDGIPVEIRLRTRRFFCDGRLRPAHFHGAAAGDDGNLCTAHAAHGASSALAGSGVGRRSGGAHRTKTGSGG